MVLTLLLACTGGGPGGGTSDSGAVADYTLNLVPVVPRNGNPFEGVDRIDLLLDTGTGEALRISLDAPGSGDSAIAENLPALTDVVIEVEGYAAGELVAWGRSAPVTASSGEVDVTVYVAEPGTAGELGSLPDAAAWSVGAALGDGRFLVLGGLSNRQSGNLGSPLDSIVSIDLSNPDDQLSWTTEEAQLPEGSDGSGVDFGKRGGAALTLITAGNDQGQYLYTGGCEDEPWNGATSATSDVQVFDPTTLEFEQIEKKDALVYSRCGHAAIGRQDGSILVWGGWGYTGDSRSIFALPNGELFDPSLRSFSNTDAPSEAGFSGMGLADLADDGTLVCGGAMLVIDDENYVTGWRTAEGCFRVSLRGTLGEEVYSGLPALAAMSMVTLGDGDVLAFGGVATGSGGKSSGQTAAASSSVWRLYHGSSTWSQVGSMKLARADAAAVLYDGTHVLIAGGSPEWAPDASAPSALSCIEIFDTTTNTSTMLGTCGEEDDAGGLPNRADGPLALFDAGLGVLLAGGLDGSVGAQAGATFFSLDR